MSHVLEIPPPEEIRKLSPESRWRFSVEYCRSFTDRLKSERCRDSLYEEFERYRDIIQAEVKRHMMEDAGNCSHEEVIDITSHYDPSRRGICQGCSRQVIRSRDDTTPWQLPLP